MPQLKQKQTTKLKKDTKKSDTGKKQGESTPTQEKADQTSQGKCRHKTFGFQEPEANNEVIQALFELAKSGKSSTAAIFWAKALCGMHEKGREKERQPSGTPTIVIRPEEKKVDR